MKRLLNAYAAFQARAALADGDGEISVAAHWCNRASRLKAAFNLAFWMPDCGAFALALDGAKHQVDAVASNMAHCLWTGIVDDDKAPAVAAHLASPTMSSGFGVRTLSTEMTAFNPMSYHNGSVWPHDTAIAVAGLIRYGFTAEAQQISLDLIDASDHFGGRLPLVVCGFGRTDFPWLVPNPTSCSPQAWAAAAPGLLLRSLLQFNPDVPRGNLLICPLVPERLLPLRVENVPLAGARIEIAVEPDGVDVGGLPAGVPSITTDWRQRSHNGQRSEQATKATDTVAFYSREGEMEENHTATVDSSSTAIDVYRAPVDSSVIRIQGGLLNPATTSVWHTVETELRRLPELVALDLSAVTDIDAAGLGVLMAAADRAGESDIAFCLVGAREGAVGKALARADLIELFEIFPAGTAP